MTRGPDKRKAPPRVDEFDDEDDTVVEIKTGSDTGAALGSATKPARVNDLAAIDDDDEDEDEATELLPRIVPNRDPNGPVSASKSAVRLEGPPAAERGVSAADDDDDDDLDDETLALPDLAAARAMAAGAASETAAGEEATADQMSDDNELEAPDEGDDQRYPPIRPLASLPQPGFEDPTMSTRSSPNVVRMTFQDRERSMPKAVPPGTSVGTLLIDAPEDAIVHIDGNAYPPGPVKLENVSRFTKFKVRVIRDGHAPWSATLSLNGKRAARIRPTLVKGPGA